MFRPIAVALVLGMFAASAAMAEESCKTSGALLPRAEIEKSLQSKGYTDIRGLKVHDGCYEAKGIDHAGKRFELEVNGQTGDIVTAE